ncbi:MAG: DEAD/DEAH box helicase family protein, partial [Planctomycetes bacterium]|nr:DEAD/DEAH box helicase family protein [Planctomycetota bacterium]
MAKAANSVFELFDGSYETLTVARQTSMISPPNMSDEPARPECRLLPLSLDVQGFASGVNGALARRAVVEVVDLPLLRGVATGPVWKPHRTPVRTFGLRFPDGVEFAPVRSDNTSDDRGDAKLERIAPPNVPGRAAASAAAKRTRLKPPKDALSLEDRLFYLLQPPLETWLAGQELIMPFEPFPYQYQGIAWLFSQQAALLADEMGLGKTMQTITALRLLLRSGQARRVLLVCPKPLIPNWQREFKLWAEELPVTVVEGDAHRRKMIWSMPGVAILVANYELLSRDLGELDEVERPRFDLVVLDEAQRIKNRDSQTARTAREITRRRSWAL